MSRSAAANTVGQIGLDAPIKSGAHQADRPQHWTRETILLSPSSMLTTYYFIDIYNLFIKLRLAAFLEAYQFVQSIFMSKNLPIRRRLACKLLKTNGLPFFDLASKRD